MYRNEFLS
jgi:transposase